LTCVGLTDSAIHPPPATGAYAYSPPGTFTPGQGGFIGLGQSYTDPVFNCSVRRVTADYPSWGTTMSNSRNGYWNADGTLFATSVNVTGQVDLIAPATGATVRSAVPWGIEGTFDPNDPDVYYYYLYQGTILHEYHVSTGTASGLLTLTSPAMFAPLGGRTDWVDDTGRYFVLNYSNALHIWDKQTNTVYGGTVTTQFPGGWAGISPDAKYLVLSGVDAGELEHWSYPIDHAGQNLSSTGTMFWSLCSDPGELTTASDGHTYLITTDCSDEAAIFRVDVSLAAGSLAQQKAQNQKLLHQDWNDGNFYSCVTRGAHRDFCYVGVLSCDDPVGDAGTWRPYEQEILEMQIVPPYAIRRLAQHRSRGPCSQDTRKPRVSASWSGDHVIFSSDFGYAPNATVEYNDLYCIEP
jgi:hypothetical protein